MAADRAASSILDGPEYLLYRFFIGLPTEYKHRFGVLVLDLNGFKQVNDRMGHQVGDRLLRDIAQRLRDVVRRAGLVARPGGDEFVLLLENISRIDDIENIVRRVLTATSIGITTFPFDDAAPETLLSHADAAVYKV